MLQTTYALFVLIATFSGLVAGWWLRSRGERPTEAPVDNDEVRRAQELLGSLQKMASTVAVELGVHNSRVEEINDELVGDKLHEPAKILNVVVRLVDANKTMQGRLDQAEDQLREKVRLVESTAAEARTDALTLLGNRRAFDADIAQCLTDFRGSGKPFTLAMIDLDKFKRLNDSYGHQAGDEVLRGTGRIMRRVLRESDSIARYGGEEFAVIFSRSTVAEAQRALNRLRKAIASTEFPGPSGKLQVTISVGATQTKQAETLESIVQRADAALYASKEAGRNCCHWHDGRTITPIAEEHNKPLPSPPEPDADKPDSGKPANATTEKLAEDLPPVLNRTAFCQHVRSRVAEWKRGGPGISLLLVDIDRFENLTRTHGPELGELLVTNLARVVFAGVREMDMVAHYSQACLAFLLPNAELPDAIRVAERIRETISQSTCAVNGAGLSYTVSLGAAEPCGADDMVSLLRKAESALEVARQSGGNRVVQQEAEESPVSAEESTMEA